MTADPRVSEAFARGAWAEAERREARGDVQGAAVSRALARGAEAQADRLWALWGADDADDADDEADDELVTAERLGVR